MIVLMQVAAFSPEETKVLGIVAVMVTSLAAALLYPIARAYARRLEGRAPAEGLRQDLADLSARLELMQHDQERVAELEARVDFAERMLAQQRDREPARLPGQ
jgi:hypothetical protein